MSAKSPYLGSRINLISKSEIRYEGTLFGVDSQASTISLSKGKFKFAYFCVFRKSFGLFIIFCLYYS